MKSLEGCPFPHAKAAIGAEWWGGVRRLVEGLTESADGCPEGGARADRHSTTDREKWVNSRPKVLARARII